MLHVKPLARWRLALRLLARDWRAGELRVLVAALVIAVAASTTIGFFTDRLARGLLNQSADLLGADLVLNPLEVNVVEEVRGWIDRYGQLRIERRDGADRVQQPGRGPCRAWRAVCAGDAVQSLRRGRQDAPAGLPDPRAVDGSHNQRRSRQPGGARGRIVFRRAANDRAQVRIRLRTRPGATPADRRPVS